MTVNKKRPYRKTGEFRDKLVKLAQQQPDVRQRWMEYPGTYSPRVLSMYRTRIRQGKMLGDGFEAKTQTVGGRTRLWVRYVGAVG